MTRRTIAATALLLSALAALGARPQDDDPVPPPPAGRVIVTVAGQPMTLENAGFRWVGRMIEIVTKEPRPGLHFRIANQNRRWVPAAGEPQVLYFTAERGGRLSFLLVTLDSEYGRTLTGSFTGTLLDNSTRANVNVTGSFELPDLDAPVERPRSSRAIPWRDDSGQALASGVGCCLMWFCFIAIACTQLWFVITAFHESVGWGFAVLFLPVAPRVFTILHWDKAKGPFLAQIVVVFVTGVCFVMTVLMHVV
jgi:hypothetical protein